ncbi:hypothetical protein [Mucilaginibacter polytrichastri]|uniref:PRTRC system protein F n=1 Tax=Mucilaginibacter polytrichastri TaxID=1302689 RepID=A0A1Q6A400_9SPHI|nr:hypothetical protein [Mucilaginibacter polytrichastri]OKS88726.1 hypothetical protein RG47T_4204 [Mucilaginibacter polytrichastri]SFT04899.1 hypothetical protein SAMN04487890_10958 [Mucilaginibacter polytrichastri]
METAPAIRSVYSKVRPLARCKGSTAKPAKKRTKGTHRNGFLTHSFRPFLSLPFAHHGQGEREFFQSLENLCQLYQWQAPDVSALPFPQNVSAVLEKLSAQRFDGASVMLLQDKGCPARLATVKTYNTNYCLYYIPVRPFWRMKNEPCRQACFELTQTLFAYLYQIAGVPYFREPGYLDNTYDSLENWINEIDDDGNEDEEEEIFRKRQFAEFELMKQAGDLLLPDIKKPLDLASWEKQLNGFSASDKYGKDLREVVYEFFKLVKDYPTRAIKDSMHYEIHERGEDDYDIYWENYISFYWSGRDSLENMLYEMVNNEFQEAGYQEEPIAVQWFDTPQDKPRHDFDFETRLFSLLNELTGILNELDNEEPNR